MIRSIYGIRPNVIQRISSRNKLSKNQLTLGNQQLFSSLSTNERADGVILDSVGLSSFPDSRGSMLGKLRDKGLLVDAIKKEQDEDFYVKTSNSEYHLKSLVTLNKNGFHGRSSLVYPKNENGFKDNPSSLRISFGGTKKITDVPRTTAMRLTSKPFVYEKAVNDFLDATFGEYENLYGKGSLPPAMIISAHSAGTPHAIRAYNILKEKGTKSDMHLRLYEPFGAKFTGFEPDENENVVSYRGYNSFMKDLYYGAGDTIGHTEDLPPSSREQLLNGTMIGLMERVAKRSVMSHTLLWMVDSYMDKNSTITKDDSLESLMSYESMQREQGGMVR